MSKFRIKKYCPFCALMAQNWIASINFFLWTKFFKTLRKILAFCILILRFIFNPLLFALFYVGLNVIRIDFRNGEVDSLLDFQIFFVVLNDFRFEDMQFCVIRLKYFIEACSGRNYRQHQEADRLNDQLSTFLLFAICSKGLMKLYKKDILRY